MVVYVGAVAVLFLFVVMMLDVDFVELKQGFLNYLPVGAVVALALLAELGLVASAAMSSRRRADRARRRQARREVTNAEAIGRVLYTDYLLLFQLAGPRAAGRHDRRDRADAAPPARRQTPGHRRAGRPQALGGRRAQGRASRAGARLMEITLTHYLFVAAALFTIGVFGIFVNRKNVIIILMSIELILLSVNINLVAFSAFLQNIEGQIFAMLVLTVAAAEAAVGLAILVTYFRNRGGIAVEDINQMRG